MLIDVVLLLGGLVYVLAAGETWSGTPAERDYNERLIGANAAGAFITVGVAASSILLATVGVLLSLGSDKQPLESEVVTQLTVAALWLVASLVFGVVAAAYALSHVHTKHSVAETAIVIKAATTQLVGLAAGGICLVVGLFLL